MTKEEKELLLKDLCARLPYGITIYRITDNSTHRIQYSDITENIDQFSHLLEYSGIDNIKPYLRPMSSMTDEEIEQMWRIYDNNSCAEGSTKVTDFLLERHLDCHHLIEKNLALVAPEDLYEK